MGCGSSVQAPAGDKPAEFVPSTPAVTAAPVDEKPVEATKPVVAEVVNFKPIHSAIRWNKPLAEIEELLVSDACVNCVDPSNGNCPIHIAAQNGHNDIIKLLIEKKVNVNAKNGKGNTGVHMAVGYDYYDAAKMLIEAGADDTLENDAGFPANLGLEGDKAMGIAALVCAASVKDVEEAFELCEQKLDKLNKVNFISAGLKAKKNIGGGWSSEHQERFKKITNSLS